MTRIETVGRFVTLTTEKGKTIEVTLPAEHDSRVFIRVCNASARVWGHSVGKPFAS